MSPPPIDTHAPPLLLVTHGIEGEPGVAAELAARLAGDGARLVGAACHKGRPDLDEALSRLPLGPVLAAPLLMAQGWTFDAIRDRLAAHPRAGDVRLAPPLGTHPGLWELVRRLALGACADRGWAPADASLLIVGHGTSRHAGASASTKAAARAIRAGRTFARVATAFLDEPPPLPAVVRALGGGRPCVAVGFFIDNGPHGRDDVGAALAEAEEPVAYTGAIGSDPRVLSYLLDRLDEARPLDRWEAAPA